MPRTLTRNLFLRLLGLIFLAAFLSLGQQVAMLIGSEGLLPASAYAEAVRQAGVSWQVPSLFLFGASDAILRGGAVLGAVLSFGLILNRAPRLCLLALWLLYLSFVHMGQDFFSFQWDNLLLETALFSLLVTPPGWHSSGRPPSRAAVFLLLWLVFRLHFESGAAKLLSGDPTWRDLSAMDAYYETAPLPTWLGWYAHQLPPGAHRLTALLTLVAELGLPFFLWAGHRTRGVVFGILVGVQLSIVLTANFAFFNYLTIALCLFLLDDDHLRWLAARAGRALPASAPAGLSGPAMSVVAVALFLLSLVPFAPWLPLPNALRNAVSPVRRVLSTTRSINAYHLFAQMTLVRREAVIEGSDDGVTWTEYDFWHKPGDPGRAPEFVAPHQPRVDFQMWFLLLGGGAAPPYFDALLGQVTAGSGPVASLFRIDPFAGAPPRHVRVAAYRYRFTDTETRRRTGAWWTRELLGTTPSRTP